MKKIVQHFTDGMMRILHAFGYSFDGFKSILRSEQAFREELILCGFCFIAAFLFDVTKTQRAMLILSLFLILCAECANTALEVLTDRISQEIHPLSKKAKDIGSFLVFLSFVAAGAVWGIILI